MMNGSDDGNPVIDAMMKAPAQQVNLEVINTIAHILEIARRGEIHGVMIVGVNKHNNTVFDAFSIESAPLIPSVLGAAALSMYKVEKIAAKIQEDQQGQQQSKILRPAPGLRLD